MDPHPSWPSTAATPMSEDPTEVFYDTEEPPTDVELPTQLFLQDAAASLPTPEEIRLTLPPTRRRRRRRLQKLVCLGLLVMAILLSFLLSSHHSSSHTASTTTTTTTTTTTDRPHSLADVVAFLMQHHVSTPRLLIEPGTPQYLAAYWMAHDDPQNRTLHDDDDNAEATIERYIFALLYFTFRGGEGDLDHWLNDMNWFAGSDVCEWRDATAAGVACTTGGRTVVGLQLRHQQVTGEIPTELGRLTSLQRLDLSHNRVQGGIPTELCRLSNLQELRLGDNRIEQKIPSCLGSLKSLKQLSLSDNLLTGSLPSSLATLSDSLTRLEIDQNELTGDPLGVFHSLTNLEWLYADHNQFTGDLGDHNSFGGHGDLRSLDLARNAFTTSEEYLPTHLFAMRKLEYLDLSHNQIKAQIPEIPVNNPILKYLSLHNNDLHGGFPTSVERLHQLTFMDISRNKFHGPLHKEFGNLVNLERLFLSDNQFYPGPIPSSFASLKALEALSVRNIRRNGTLPAWVESMDQLSFLDLGGNSFHGPVPGLYGGLSSLEYLLLDGNQLLTGDIPVEFADMMWIKALFLDGNDLSSGAELERLCSQTDIDLLYTDCHDDALSEMSKCSCCTCCAHKQGCSGPFLVNLQNTWEQQDKRTDNRLGDS